MRLLIGSSLPVPLVPDVPLDAVDAEEDVALVDADPLVPLAEVQPAN